MLYIVTLTISCTAFYQFNNHINFSVLIGNPKCHIYEDLKKLKLTKFIGCCHSIIRIISF